MIGELVSEEIHQSLPRWMREAHYYDLDIEEQWQKLVNDLHKSCETVRVPFMVEDKPDDFVERPEEFDQLLALLLDLKREEPIAITAALRGAGGYGKTTLAKALCHDEAIQNAFDDGILWITLGENPGDLTGRVEDLIYTISGSPRWIGFIKWSWPCRMRLSNGASSQDSPVCRLQRRGSRSCWPTAIFCW